MIGSLCAVACSFTHEMAGFVWWCLGWLARCLSRAGARRGIGGCLVGVAGLLAGTGAHASLVLSPAQSQWLAQHGQHTFKVSFDPYTGMDSFLLLGRREGFLHLLLQDIHAQTGLTLVPDFSSDWDEAYARFLRGETDILYGANPTPEREAIMRFTAPALRAPYVVLARRDSLVKTLADLHEKRVGFIASDFVMSAFPEVYPRIRYEPMVYPDQSAALSAVLGRGADAFITAGGGAEVEYVVANPKLAVVAHLRSITSDMTFAVPHRLDGLAGILGAYLKQRSAHIDTLIGQARSLYNRKAFRLSEDELAWLAHSGEAVVGVAEDYLPFDFHEEGQYKGIAGEVLQEVARSVGFNLKVVAGPFATLIEEARAGRIHVLNMAKTTDRLADFAFPHPFGTERDIVIGRRSSPPLPDIYALENKRVAVVDGFWHEEYLRQNLRSPQIVRSQDVVDALRKVRRGDADYLIENPTVADFYISGLGYQDLVKRGDTSGDSFLYFGVSRTQPALAGILDKVIPTLPHEEIKFRALQQVPAVTNESNRRLIWLAALLAFTLLAVVVVTAVIARKLTNERLHNQFLREKEELLYTDGLTGFLNRNHYTHHFADIERAMVPGMVVMAADLNHLKRANDTYGHAVGDRLLQAFAQAVRAQWPQATVYRMGGDEFLMYWLGGAADLALQAEAFHERCQHFAVEAADRAVLYPFAALGWVVKQQDATSWQQLVAQADEAMYAAKAQQKRRRNDGNEVGQVTSGHAGVDR